MKMVVKLTLGLLLLSLACERYNRHPELIIVQGNPEMCADVWGMYSDSGKIDKEVGELFDLTLKLKEGKDIVGGCSFSFNAGFERHGRVDKAGIYQWQSKGKVNKHILQGEIEGDELTFSNLYLYNHFLNEDDISGQGKFTAATIPFNAGGRLLDNSLSFAFTENSGVTGKFKFSPAKDVFVYSVENGKASSNYKIAIATNDTDKLLLKKEITLNSNGRGQLDVPVFSRDCSHNFLARMEGADDRITFSSPSYPCIEDKDGIITVNEQGHIEFSSKKTGKISNCQSPDNSLQGEVKTGLSYTKYADYPTFKKLGTEGLELSMDTDGVLKGEVGVIPSYNSDSCHYVKLSLNVYCCGLNASPGYRPCWDNFHVSQKVGNGC